MVSYKCNTCNKVFNHKGNFKRHLDRKFPCKKVSQNIADNEPIKSDTDNTFATDRADVLVKKKSIYVGHVMLNFLIVVLEIVMKRIVAK